MLTLKAPLTLICNPSVISSKESFYHRITGNYGVIASGIEREDLLHMVTAPPELYLEERGMTNLIQNTQIQNHQEQKLLMINNLLNRIAIMEEAHLTYQDRVYISSMLQKLGIEDVRQFMTQVHKSKENIETTEQLVSLYWNHLGELREMVEAYHSQEKTQKMKTEHTERERLLLHEEILKRLQTGAIYQILHNFYSSQSRHSMVVTDQELRTAEQKQTAVQILLSQLKQEIQGEKVPLVYRNENYYETSAFWEGEITEEKVSKQMTAAVLLDAFTHLYLSQFEKKQSQEQLWLSITHALHQSAENTFYRLRTGWLLSQIERKDEQYFQTFWQQQSQKQEIELVQQLLINRWEAKKQLHTIQERYGQDSEKLWEYLREQAEIRYRKEDAEAQGEEALLTDEKREKAAEEQKQTEKSKEEKTESVQRGKYKGSIEEQKLDKEKDTISLEILEKTIKERSNEEAFFKNKEEKAAEESSAQMILRTFTKEESIDYNDFTEQYFAWIEEQKKFYQRIEQYLNISQMSVEDVIHIAKEQMQYKEKEEQKNLPASILPSEKGYKEQAAKAAETVFLKWQEQETEPVVTEEISLKAYQENEIYNREHKHPTPESQTQQSLQEFLTEQHLSNDNRTDIRFTQEHTNQTILQEDYFESQVLPSSDEAAIIKQQLQKINQQNIANYTAYQKMQKAQKSEQKHAVLAKRDMRKDSLKALQNPEFLLQEIQKAQAEDAQRRQKERMQFAQLLPEQTKQVYQRLEQYLNAPEKQKESDSISKNNMASLLYDIRQVEKEHTVREQLPAEDLRQIQETSQEVLEKWEASAVPGALDSHRLSAASPKPPLSFIHKSSDSQLYEEWLYELLKENQTTNQTIRSTEQEEYRQETSKKTIYQQSQQILEKESVDFTEMIQKGVQRQIGAISEQIYSKLEKRLQNEKKRRGY